jgi:hypothetical protein
MDEDFVLEEYGLPIEKAERQIGKATETTAPTLAMPIQQARFGGVLPSTIILHYHSRSYLHLFVEPLNELLGLARDYLDRMATLDYGLFTKKEYSLRSVHLLANEEFDNRLKELRDKDALTSNGWLIRWAGSRHIDLQEDGAVI